MAVTPIAGAVPLTQFTAAQQAQLRAGQVVGNYQVLNGHVMDTRTPTGQALLAQRQATTPTTTTAAPVNPAPNVTKPTYSPGEEKGGWMHLGDGPYNYGHTTMPDGTQLIGDRTGGSSTAPDAGTAAQRDALALIRTTLAQYGLPDSLADWAWSEIVAGKGTNEVLLDLRQRPEFKQAFPEIDARQKAGLAPLSPGDIINYREQARQMMMAAGLPPGFYDSNDDFSKWIIEDKSLSEMAQHIADASNIAYNFPEQDKQEFYNLGFGHGDLTAMALNPDIAQPLLHKQLAAAQLSGTAVRAGYGGLNANEALGLTEQGITPQQAQTGFGNLTHQQELFTPINAGETAISREDQLAAAFGGNANAQDRITARARGRQAEFAGGGNYASSQSGISGLGGSSN